MYTMSWPVPVLDQFGSWPVPVPPVPVLPVPGQFGSVLVRFRCRFGLHEEACAPISGVFGPLMMYNVVQIASCYAVYPGYRIGAFLLLGGTMLSGLSSMIMDQACERAIEDKEHKAEEKTVVPWTNAYGQILLRSGLAKAAKGSSFEGKSKPLLS